MPLSIRGFSFKGEPPYDESSQSRSNLEKEIRKPFGLLGASSIHVHSVMEGIDNFEKPRFLIKLYITYTICMALIAIMALTGQIIVQVFVNNSYGDSAVLRMAQNQSRLSQSIAKNALYILHYSASRTESSNSSVDALLASHAQELEASLQAFSAGNSSLNTGNSAMGIPAPSSNQINSLLLSISPSFNAIFLSGTSIALLFHQWRSNRSVSLPGEIQPLVDTIFASDAPFSALMAQIVSEYSRISRTRLGTLAVVTWVTNSVLFLTILLEFALVFRPNVRNMAGMVEERFDLFRASLQSEAGARSVALLLVEYIAHEIEEPLKSTVDAIRRARRALKRLIPSTEAETEIEGEPEARNGVLAPLLSPEREAERPAVLEHVSAAVAILKEARGSCQLMSTVVNDVSDMRNLQNGEISIQHSSADVADVVRKAVQRVFQPSPAVTLSCDVSDDVAGMKIVTDVFRLEQVIIGLISNAIKFTSEGSIRVRVSSPDQSWVQIQISDTGPGVSEEMCAKVFMPFAGGNARTSGFGLYIVRLLVEALGGTMGVSSLEGQGSNFWVLLPVDPEAADTAKLNSILYKSNKTVQPGLPTASTRTTTEASNPKPSRSSGYEAPVIHKLQRSHSSPSLSSVDSVTIDVPPDRPERRELEINGSAREPVPFAGSDEMCQRGGNMILRLISSENNAGSQVDDSSLLTTSLDPVVWTPWHRPGKRLQKVDESPAGSVHSSVHHPSDSDGD